MSKRIMLFKIVDDWKQNLPPEDEVRLNGIIRNVAKYRTAYRSSKDVKIAQLWCALLELDKKNSEASKEMKKLKMIIEGFAEVIKKAEEQDDKDLIKSLERF